MNSHRLYCLTAFLMLLFAAASTRAATILIIDLSDLSQVTFSVTGANAENDDTDTFLQEGISLIGFFPSILDSASPIFFDSSSLFSPGGSFAYTTLLSNDFSGGTNYVDLNVFGSGFSTQDFSTAQPALTGLAEADLTDWIGFLPAAGSTGAIFSGDGVSAGGVLIGQYLVVPEPAAAALVALGTLGLVARRRRAR